MIVSNEVLSFCLNTRARHTINVNAALNFGRLAVDSVAMLNLHENIIVVVVVVFMLYVYVSNY